MKVGETYASHMTQFVTIAEIVGNMFGGGKKKPTEDLSDASPEAFIARTNQLFGGG